MADLGDIKSLDKLKDKLSALEKKAPGKIYEKYDKLGNDIKKELKSATPDGKDKKKPKKKKLKNSWIAEKTVKEDGVYIKRIRNKAPHFGPVERGHKVVARRATVKNGRKGEQRRVNLKSGKSFVSGKFFFKKKMSEIESKIIKQQEKMIDDLFEEVFSSW